MRINKHKKEIEKSRRRHRQKRYATVVLMAIVAIGIFAYFLYYNNPNPAEFVNDLRVLPGFKIEVFAYGPSIVPGGERYGLRFMQTAGDKLLVAVPKAGKVMAYKDMDNDGFAETGQVFIRGLNNPHSIAKYKDWIYIAEEDKVIRVKYDGMIANKSSAQLIVELPKGGKHRTRTISIYREQLYISIGSSCNNCIEKDPRRGMVMQCELDRDVCDPYATGLRNAAGLEWYGGKLYATENGRDWLGEDLPIDEINRLEKGKDYGWPKCHGRQEVDPDYDAEDCEKTELPVFDIGAHSDPQGMEFYFGNMYPVEYEGDLFVAYHGSWNRQDPVGYKVVRIFVDEAEWGTRLAGVEDFVSGFRLRNGEVLGRPVDVETWKDGSLLISDDEAGVVYRVYSEKE